MTYAFKSRKLLYNAGIEAKVIKIDMSLSENGCNYGIEIDYSDFYEAIRELKTNDIVYSVYNPTKN